MKLDDLIKELVFHLSNYGNMDVIVNSTDLAYLLDEDKLEVSYNAKLSHGVIIKTAYGEVPKTLIIG